MAERKPCSFCSPSPSEFPHFSRYGRERLDVVPILETPNLIVKPDILPVDPDGLHFLVVPKRHKYSFAASPDIAQEVGAVRREMEDKTGEALVYFEHGGVEEGNKNMSVYHQHAHMIPARGNDVLAYMGDRLRALALPHQFIATPDESPVINLQALFRGHPYVYIQQGRYGLWAESPDDQFPSQIAQRGMSALLSGWEIDWKQITQSEEHAKLSVARIAQALERCRQP